MKKVLVFLPFYLFASLPLSAQTFTQRVQQQQVTAGGIVTIHHDAAIDELVNGKPEPLPVLKKETKTPARKQTASDKRDQQQTTDKRDQQQTNAKRDQQQQLEKLVEQTEQTIDSLIMEPQRTRQVMGYRIQVFAGGKTRADRQKAEQTASTLKSLFPGQKVYVHFYSPRWICRLGNFRTIEEAREMLSEVVKMGYDQATLVRGKVTVPY